MKYRLIVLTAGESILEDLLEAQELKDRQIHRGMEAETTFVWAQRRVELHTIATVDLHLALIVFPCDTELDHSLRDGSNLECLLILWVLLEKA